MPEPASDRAAAVRALTAEQAHRRGPLLEVLHAVQARFGHLERADLEAIADVLNLSVADVHGVVSFYHDFRTSPPTAHRVALCRAEACQAVGAEALCAAATAELAGAADVEIAEVFCLGNCALGPSGTVDGRLHGRLTAQRVAQLVAQVRS
ncbi:MAG TPA: NAD(P)H-dependent oxidoreductase subunit E [Dermatophilaceae bacterium]|nr:NAD(P)H-dependent oxidoreductase subunit E [Dermatophilaceae bacterium]